MIRQVSIQQDEKFLSSVQKSFEFLKSTVMLDELFVRGVRLPEKAGYLLPLCQVHRGGESFEAAMPGAIADQYWDSATALMLIVADATGKPHGYLGIRACAGRSILIADSGPKAFLDEALMVSALKQTCTWAQEQFAPAQIALEVATGSDALASAALAAGLTPQGTSGNAGARLFIFGTSPGWEPAQLILTAGPSISAREASYAWDAARNGWNRQWSGYLQRFEFAFAEYIGVKHAIATSSCTGALQLALLALGVGPGDEVVVPDVTWVATANAVLYTGATPVFADIEADSWCLDPDSFRAAITTKTKAVIPVHLYGHPARMDRIIEIARQHGLYVVEDAAPSIGAEYHGQRTGSFGDIAGFSFQGAKLVVTGEGGMLVTNNEELYRRAHKIWDQGRDPTKAFWIDERGWKYKMSNIQAAIGLGQLERVDELIEAKRQIFSWYEEGLTDLDCVSMNREIEGARSIYWMSSILLEDNCPIAREELRARLRQRNVDSRPVFPAISQYPIWDRELSPQPVAKRVGERAINLPSGVCLRREEVEYICRCIRESVA
jgi:perosamine synthetase